MRLLRPFVLLVFVAAAGGCVSSSRFEDKVEENTKLAWKLEAAERQATKAEADKKLAQREVQLAREETRVLKERLQNESEALRHARIEMDEELKARIEELQAKAGGKNEVSQYGGVILETGIMFASGSHDLTAKGKEMLGSLCEALSGPKYEGWLIEVAGHTDSDPLKLTAKRYEDNHCLAAMRANSVRRFLETKGVPSGRLYLSAWADTRPLKPETDRSSKAENRRVEIVLHREGAKTLPASAKPGEADTAPASAPQPSESETPVETTPAENKGEPTREARDPVVEPKK